MKLRHFIKKKRWTIFIFLTFLLGLYIMMVQPMINTIIQEIKQAKSLYAIVLDAHLSVTHMYVYTFHRSYPEKQIIFDDEQYVNMTPGIFKLDENTGNITVFKVALQYLLEMASNIVPKTKHLGTPLLLRGISNIPLNGDQTVEDEEFDAMEYLMPLIRKSWFYLQPGYISKQSSQEIEMNLWTAITTLQGEKTALISLDCKDMYVMYKTRNVDGTFNNNVGRFWDNHMIHDIGLSIARLSTLSYRSKEDRDHVISSCFNPRVVDVPWTLEMNERQFLVSGPNMSSNKEGEKNDYKKTFVDKKLCMTILKKYINQNKKGTFHHSRHMQDDEIEINISGYFYSRAVQAGLIKPHSVGMHKVTVGDFVNASDIECATLNQVKPWLCLDLTYISLLLSDVLNLASHRTLTMSRYANGRLSWPLGLAKNTWVEIFLKRDNASVLKEY